MAEESTQQEILNPEDFMASAEPCDVLEEILQSAEEVEKQIEDQSRAQEDWSYLANKVVGREGVVFE